MHIGLNPSNVSTQAWIYTDLVYLHHQIRRYTAKWGTE